MNHLLAGLVIMFGVVYGCQSMSTGEEFKYLMDRQIGKQIANSWYRDPDEKKQIGGGNVEYIIHSKKSACVWSFLVDESNGIILSWRYISAPSVCGVHTSSSW